ncbi:unnamed protein product [Prorocentrum cordatum]|uniref:Uncharacterized protein n=1 Tax=Prorocentrum cordatum TaxID=2364126 RepID=A0ABN9QSP0_9DINO|nr:unnamed protein product [Polarella glacialis]
MAEPARAGPALRRRRVFEDAPPPPAGPTSEDSPEALVEAPREISREDLTNTPSPLDRPEPALAEAAAGAVGGRRQPQRRRLQLQDAPMLPDYSMQPDGVASTAGPPQQPVQRAARAAQPDQRTAGPAPRARVALQRYSLKSRRAAPYPVPCLPKSAESLSRGAQVPQVSLQALWPPRGVTAHVQERPARGCSGDPFLSQGRRRLCLLDTEDHAEYQLLEAMGGLFAAETHSCSTSVSKRASMQMIQVEG